jgi:hypothetical protein
MSRPFSDIYDRANPEFSRTKTATAAIQFLDAAGKVISQLPRLDQ